MHGVGLMVILVFFVIQYLGCQTYSSKFLKVDDDDFPNLELFIEGLGPSFALFLLIWTAVYSN